MARPPALLLSSLAMAMALVAASSSLVNSQPLPGCPSRCGDVRIHYPFGIRDGCYRENFDLVCNETFSPPVLYRGNVPVLEINLSEAEMRVSLPIARDCFSKKGEPLNTGAMSADLTGSPFTISPRRNLFTVTGCDTLVYMSDTHNFGFSTGCASVCRNITGLRNGTCSGIGCCQTSIPEGLKYFMAEFRSFNNHTRVWRFNPCSYAFVSEKDSFVFNTSFLAANYAYETVRMPAVFDWAMESETCAAAKRDLSSYACLSSHSYCLASNNGLGYMCRCSEGYRGNPYLSNGCQDIDECKETDRYPCQGICANTPGSYNCTCPVGRHAKDPKTQNCTADSIFSGREFPLAVTLGTGLGSGFLFLILVCSWIYWGFQKRKTIQLRHKFFQQNGGLFLQQQVSPNQANSFKIFTIAELERATGNFSEDRVLGKGGHGTVYRGELDDDRVVAVKKSMMVDESKSKEFAKEMLILSQINHVNVVKLLGCCLEVEVPMLVYEYVPNGTLFHYIHEKRHQIPISFEVRLRIAAEAAEALSYLHAAASPPILHGDVKSSNILLDGYFKAKVSDFGTSLLAPNDKAQFTTLVQGTCGYLDPEYLQTCQLTEKSDVYSFGVVLVELLTGKKALHFGGSEAERSLALNFISCMSNNRLLEILDPQVVTDGLSKELQHVAHVAMRCLQLKGEDRPTMKEVVMELEALRKSCKHPWVPQNLEETEKLLCIGETSATNSYDNTGYHSLEMENKAMLKNIELGR